MPKYHNKKIVVDGNEFDSLKEVRRWQELKLLERAGNITELERQVKFVLVPAQYAPVLDKKKGIWKERCVERECAYIADFVYKDSQGNRHVEDIKGYKGGGAYAVFTVKRKLMYYIHNIIVEEI